MSEFKRTHVCGDVTEKVQGQEVVVTGWVNNRRDHGGLVFIDLRDRSGLVQVAIDPTQDKSSHEIAEIVRSEFVIAVRGSVEPRPEGTVNPKLKTGKIEIKAKEVSILNPSKTPPFILEEADQVSEDLRLQYRYIDLRRPKMQEALKVRHDFCLATRNYLDEQGFLEVETPILTKSTPEGARDYLVPNRLNAGTFFALPQSPQIMKQLLMVGGTEKYFQISRCFRDEDLRADRQPEFTQIDLEMSFAGQEEVFAVTEGMMQAAVKKSVGVDIKIPFNRMTYVEAMDRFGSDKPDLRFDLELKAITDLVDESDFKVFKSVKESGGLIKGILGTGCAGYSRKQVDDLTKYVGNYGAKGLAWFKVTDSGVDSPIAKFFPEALQQKIVQLFEAKAGDMIFFVADKPNVVNASLSALRNWLGKELKLVDEDKLDFTWIIDFPLFGYNEEEKRVEPEHHAFTAPLDEDLHLLDTDPVKVRSSSYDLVLNGSEVASGSVRIHDQKVQEKIFRTIKLTDQDIKERFGFFVEALKYGAPPHAGVAPGLDRILTILLKRESIRDVIAFPKTASGTCLMTSAPSTVDPKQVEELHLKIQETE